MSKILKFRRDTTSGISTITGSEGELFVDLTKDTLVVMDGTTTGGQALQKEITQSTNITAGIITATAFSGNATSSTYATNAGIATYATNAGIATYATNAGIATYATSAGISTTATTALGFSTTASVNTTGIITASSLYATSAFILNPNSINANYTVPANFNAMSIGPTLSISNGIVVTVQSGASWSIVP